MPLLVHPWGLAATAAPSRIATLPSAHCYYCYYYDYYYYCCYYYTCMCTHIHICIYTLYTISLSLYIYIYIYVCIYVYMCVYIYIYIYVCMYVCIYIYIYIYIDMYIGSLGSFMNFRPKHGAFEANPPLSPTILADMREHMHVLLKQADGPMSFVVTVANWEHPEVWASAVYNNIISRHIV